MLVWDAGKASAALLLVSKKKLLIYPKGSNAGPLPLYVKTRRQMARERRGAGSSLVSMETQF